MSEIPDAPSEIDLLSTQDLVMALGQRFEAYQFVGSPIGSPTTAITSMKGGGKELCHLNAYLAMELRERLIEAAQKQNGGG